MQMPGWYFNIELSAPAPFPSRGALAPVASSLTGRASGGSVRSVSEVTG